MLSRTQEASRSLNQDKTRNICFIKSAVVTLSPTADRRTLQYVRKYVWFCQKHLHSFRLGVEQ